MSSPADPKAKTRAVSTTAAALTSEDDTATLPFPLPGAESKGAAQATDDSDEPTAPAARADALGPDEDTATVPFRLPETETKSVKSEPLAPDTEEPPTEEPDTSSFPFEDERHRSSSQQALEAAAASRSVPSLRASRQPTPPAGRGWLQALGPGGSARPYAAVALVLTVVVGGLVAVATHGGDDATARPTAGTVAPLPRADDPDEILLQRAVEIADQDVELAHNLLRAVGERSPVRSQPAFARVEAQWADWMLAQADAANDFEERVRILYTLSRTESVDSVRRQQAAEILLALAFLPEAASADEDGVTDAGMARGAAARRSAAAGTRPGAQEPDSASGAASPRRVGWDRYDPEVQRRRLEAAVASGRASTRQIRMLRAICSTQGDRQCRDRATRLLEQRSRP